MDQVAPVDWNNLCVDATPFMRHEFLAGLEQHIPLQQHGWYPQHLLMLEDNRPVAAMPAYLKSNSWGEFVFDWSWAEAYERAGGDYYPKLVSAVPFTPVSGPRLLASGTPVQAAQRCRDLIRAAQEAVREKGLSSYHCLFPVEQDISAFMDSELLIREACQYHWLNHDYRDFEDFLDQLSAKKRKRIRKERREVQESGIEFQVYDGHQISDELWQLCHQFYCSTFHYKGNTPRLTLDFFRHLGKTMPDETLLFVASLEQRPIAIAFAMRDEHTLYGRHWGCNLQLRHLHFELCYYQTIEYCITNGLQCLNAGAQGEHKVGRGFTPVKTMSAHYFPEQGFARAVSDFLCRERNAVDHYMDELESHSAYRNKVAQE
jgi:hypothetical protein